MRLWSRVLSHDMTVVPSCRYDGEPGAGPDSRELSASDRRIGRSFRRSGADRVALQRLDVLDERGHLGTRDLSLEARHHRLEAVDDLGRGFHHRFRQVGLVDVDEAAVGELLAAARTAQPGRADTAPAGAGVAPLAAALG